MRTSAGGTVLQHQPGGILPLQRLGTGLFGPLHRCFRRAPAVIHQQVADGGIQRLFPGLEHGNHIFSGFVLCIEGDQFCIDLRVILLHLGQPDLHQFLVIMDAHFQGMAHSPFLLLASTDWE